MAGVPPGGPGTGPLQPTRATVVFGGDRRTTNLDLVLAVLLALGLPYLCSLLLESTGGALAGLAAYYLLGCVAPAHSGPRSSCTRWWTSSWS